MRVLLDDVRSSGEVSMLYLSVHSRNIAAKALYKSIGFRAYGLQRYSLLVDGEYVDEELMDLRVTEAQ
jgi:RimJ/RimL family protein N-acetyltransferase